MELANGFTRIAEEFVAATRDTLETTNGPALHEADTSNRPVEALLDRYLEEIGNIPWYRNLRPASYPSAKAILEADPRLQVAILRAALERLPAPRPGSEMTSYSATWHLRPLLSLLVKRRLPFHDADVVRILDQLGRLAGGRSGFQFSGFLHAIESYVAGHGISKGIQAGLGALRDALHEDVYYWGADGRKQVARIDRLLAGGKIEEFSLDPRDDWGALAREAFDALDEDTGSAWLGVLRHAETAKGSKPSGIWLRDARALFAGAAEARLVGLTVRWLDLLGQPRREVSLETMHYRDAAGNWRPSAVVSEKNGDLLKGLAWSAIVVANDRVATALGAAAEASFKKIPNVGARSAKVGNACVYALGALPGTTGVAQLSRLDQRVKLPSARKMIEAALSAAAERNGLTRGDLEEVAVPTFGLSDGGLGREVGGYVAELAVSGPQQVNVTWRDADGKLVRGEPSEIKRSFPAERKAIKRLADDLRTTLTAQRDRIEALFLAERAWDPATWRERYLDHPLLGVIARRLIWAFDSGGSVTLGAWIDGRIVDVQDQPLDAPGEGARVRLWHPIGWDPSIVLAWRDWLERHQVTQPFKQAHREVYLLTDAERATATYSNRFAAHVLRQHQLSALCQHRGWRYRLQGIWDGGTAPSLDLPRHDLRVTFWCEGVEDPAAQSGSGVFLYVTTDQVRFDRMSRRDPVPLAEVPALVFSEVLRDVDLFVGVCSVGNDPTWTDQNPGQFRDYWEAYSLGDLSETARTRRAILERLLPRLTKIAGRCTLAERFLIVRGDRRTYKIHLGSGNILMEPNHQYLCIVPRGGGELGSDHVFLPFEGDSVLSIILSKAFLLADDRSIKDPTILRQIT